MKKRRIIGVIPARYTSTRLPGKPLIKINGMEMISHVYNRAIMSTILDDVIVATDDERILDLIRSIGGRAEMTKSTHKNGTERTYEISTKVKGDVYVVINGDEPLLNPEYIDTSVNALLSSKAEVAILYNKFYKRQSPADFKVVVNNKSEVMYISRSDIPFNHKSTDDFLFKAYHIMSFSRESLKLYVGLEQTRLDRLESHELIRLLEHGYKIQGVEVDSEAISVDTKQDLKYVISMMKKDHLSKEYNSNVQ
jgi:3-deoxy-manno-octulosonate cytidylyltransferase (CMP-KDO synthetase)